MLNPRRTDAVLRLLGRRGQTFDPIFHNTASLTMGSGKTNVIPGEIHFQIDGRLLPGLEPAGMIAELRHALGEAAELEIERHDPGPAELDMALFDTLGGVLREADPEGIPIPLLLTAVTDARFFSRPGIRTYGCLPMQLPKDFDFTRTIPAPTSVTLPRRWISAPPRSSRRCAATAPTA